MWLTLAFTSAALLGFYDAAKKQSLTGNAVLPVRKAADFITYSNNDDGVAHVVEKFML